MKDLPKKAQEIDYLIAEDTEKNRVMGVIGLGGGRVRTFFVHPDYQGKGIGRKLYSHIEEKAKTQGLQELIVVSSKYAEPIYEMFGFKKIEVLHKEKNGGYYQEVLMKKVFI
ncbi:MAG: GNAT family N-acetyltransferase [Rhabdochlamydiaceae bacterium]